MCLLCLSYTCSPIRRRHGVLVAANQAVHFRRKSCEKKIESNSWKPFEFPLDIPDPSQGLIPLKALPGQNHTRNISAVQFLKNECSCGFF